MAEKKWTRARVVAFVCYPNSATQDLTLMRQALADLHVKAAISPLHDQDKYDEFDVLKWHERNPSGLVSVTPPHVGDLKKPHYHVLMCFAGSKSPDQLQLWTEQWSKTPIYFEKVQDSTGYLRYLAHLDEPDKAHYDVRDVEPYGGIDLAPLYAASKAEGLRNIGGYITLICENDITNFLQLIDFADRQNDLKLMSAIYEKPYFWGKVVEAWDYASRQSRLRYDSGLKSVQGYDDGFYFDGSDGPRGNGLTTT